jgi:hypothetical protein
MKELIIKDAKFRIDETPMDSRWGALNERDKDIKKDLDESFIQLSLGEALFLVKHTSVYGIDYEGVDYLIETDSNSVDSLIDEIVRDWHLGVMFAVEK